MKAKLSTVPLIFGCTLLAGNAMSQEYAFLDVVFTDQNQPQETVVLGINDEGVMVGTYAQDLDVRSPVKLGSKGFILRGDQWETLQATGMGLPSVSAATEAIAINNNDVVVGQYWTAEDRIHGFIYDGVSFKDILPPTAMEAVVNDITDDGVIIGSYSTGVGLSQPNTDDLGGHGFRGFPDGQGGYSYELFDFQDATSTFANGRNSVGTEVGTGVSQSILDTEIFGYVLPDEKYQYPLPNALVGSTQFVSVNDNGIVLGNATSIELEQIALTGRTQAFLIDVGEFGGPNPPSPQDIELPCPDCSFDINPLNLEQSESGRRSAMSINNRSQIVGFYDNNDGFARGFIGTPKVGDFDGDGDYTCDDIDLIYGDIMSGAGDPTFDLDGDGNVGGGDVESWLAEAGSAKGFSGPIRSGDANLDGRVNANDLNQLGLNWLETMATSWCQGDFNHDGRVDPLDLNDVGVNWNSNITVAPAEAAVPEPKSAMTAVVLLCCFLLLGRKRRPVIH